MILAGRVSCRLKRNQSCKEYVSGSYFGDFDALNNRSRLFSVKVEDPLQVVVVSRKELEAVLENDPLSRLKILQSTIRRYIEWKEASRKINCFNLVTARSDWWTEEENNGSDTINKKIEKWIDLICKMKKADLASVS